MKIHELPWPPGVTLCVSDEPESQARQLADEAEARIRSLLRARDPGRVTVAVSGGSTPRAFFHCLSQAELPWEQVDVTLADERWVPEESTESNARLVREHLLQNRAGRAAFHPLKNSSAGQPPEDYDCPELAGLLPIDLLVLGMGNDGHCASLFPDAPELPRALSDHAGICLPVHPPSQAQSRITLSAAVLRQAGWTALLLRGEDKLETLERALQAPERVREMPIRAFLDRELSVFWSP